MLVDDESADGGLGGREEEVLNRGARNQADSHIEWTKPWGLVSWKAACTRWRNGWTATPAKPLGAARTRDLRSWALRTHLMLCFIDGNAGRFGDETFEGEYVVPPMTTSRAIFENEQTELNRTAVGICRSSSDANFIWSFGYPTILPKTAAPGLARFAPATIVTIGTLQMWIVTPTLEASVSVPTGIVSCDPSVRPADLLSMKHRRTVDEVVVSFPSDEP